MVGTDLNLTLPSASDPMATIIADIVTALTAIEDSFADLVTPAAMNITSGLSMGGNWLTNTGAVLFVGGNEPSAAGSLYYADDEFFVKTAAGTVQLTAAGVINVGSVGGISGMSGGASVSYDSGSEEYEFFSDIGVNADLKCNDLVLVGSAGTVRVGVDAALTGNKVVRFKSVPTSGVSLMAFDAAATAIQPASTAKITETIEFTATNVDTLTVTTANKHSYTASKRVPVHNGIDGISSAITSESYNGVRVNGSRLWHQLLDMQVGDRITEIRVRHNKATTGSSAFQLWTIYDDGVSGDTLVQTFNSTTSGAQTTTCTISSPVTVAEGEAMMFMWTGADDTDSLNAIAVDWIRP